MMTNIVFTFNQLILFSLAWFVVGVVAGFVACRGALSPSDTVPARRRHEGCIELYVGNLSYDLTEKDLRREFEEYGRVASVRIIENRFNGKSKGYGFVEMENRQGAEAAIRAMNGRELKGRKIVLNEAKSKARGDD